MDSLSCPLCISGSETIEHLFIEYPLESHGLCHHGQSDSILSTIFSIADWIKAIINPSLSLGISKAEEHKFIIHAAVFCDVTWMSRNEVGSCTGW